jgi:hypothetical protein
MSSSSDETKLGPDPALRGRRTTPSSRQLGWLTSLEDADGRIDAGTILANRYRVTGLLGRGGMGEVYRADDLRLAQVVALKFLPAAVADDATRLAQFHNEVRIARQVSHRNVCRVYDISEDSGRVFLTMEHVDGEDLATLLKRVGHFPQDKGVEVARQICAGLAAAHERGVLHRDLKPANIMLDGVADEIHDVRSGTPAYMAPEQLAGQGVSVRSDLYALGLVLYEIFTGKRAFDAKTVAELLRMHDQGVELTPTSDVRDLDPSIELIIQRCVQADPARRPTSALSVAAALPGGDPLAAALAAGETPSPELVAAAGQTEAVPLPTALVVLSAALAALLVVGLWNPSRLIINAVPFKLSPEVLADRAETMLARLGYTETPVDRASGFAKGRDYLAYIRRSRQDPGRWDALRTGRPPALLFWHRTSPRSLVPDNPLNLRLGPTEPALDVSGMTIVILDTLGRLVELQVMPPQRESPPAGQAPVEPTRPPDWGRLFAAAGIDQRRFAPATPEWTPFGYADTRAAWTGTIAELDDTPMRIEAAAYRGRPTFFGTIGPWSRPSRMQRAPTDPVVTVLTTVAGIILVGLLAGAALLARRNLRLGRGDRKGAKRLAILRFTLNCASFVVGARHFSALGEEMSRVAIAVAFGLLEGGLAWLLYLALEPLVRRHWPDGLIAWTRLFAGKWRDPLVGRDVLVGIACGAGLMVLTIVLQASPRWLGMPPAEPSDVYFELLEGPRMIAFGMMQAVESGIETGLLTALIFVLLLALLRRRTLAAAGTLLVVGLVLLTAIFSGDSRWWFEALAMILLTGAIVGALVAFGVLATVTMLATNLFLELLPAGLDASAWYSSSSIAAVMTVAALACAAFYVSRGYQRGRASAAR